jgi:hypothetical protein
MSTSQHSQLSIVPGIGRRDESEPSDGRYEPTIGLKAVARISDCSAEQCRWLAEAKKIPCSELAIAGNPPPPPLSGWREEQRALIRHSRPSEER